MFSWGKARFIYWQLFFLHRGSGVTSVNPGPWSYHQKPLAAFKDPFKCQMSNQRLTKQTYTIRWAVSIPIENVSLFSINIFYLQENLPVDSKAACFSAFNYDIYIPFKCIKYSPKTRKPLMGFSSSKLTNSHEKRKMSVGWAQCTWTWRRTTCPFSSMEKIDLNRQLQQVIAHPS